MPAARPALTIQHLFALAVAAFALLHGGFGIATGDKALLGVAAAGLVFALAGWFSAAIPTFLRIFSGIFSVEYCLFGLPVLLQRTGVARENWADFIPPVSLPVTVAVFGIIIWAIARIPAIRTIMRIADLFFDTRERNVARVWPLPAMQVRESRLATLAVVVLVVINQAQVAINVRLSYFSRDWFNAIQDKNEPEFWRLLIYVFFLWAVIYITSAVVEYVIQSGLTIRWRQWLTDHLTTEWLQDGSHYRMTLAGRTADNPDQRIAVDVNSFVTSTYGFSIQLLATVSSLVSFSIVLWSISAAFTLPYTDIAVPGLLFWVALVYAGLGTLFTHLIGRRLAGLNFEQQRYEADFRFSLARLREYSEQVSLLRGEPAERHLIMERFAAVIRNFWRIVNVRKALMGFTAGYGQVSSIVPYVIVAPFYFSGKIALGTMQQTAGAFARVQGALDFFVNYYVDLADYKAVIDRLSTFDTAIHKARGLGKAPPRIEHEAAGSDAVSLAGLDLGLPDGRTIVTGAALSLPAGQATLITGPSGSGKSTLMRAIAGIWPYGHGTIEVPQGASVMLLPQRPYIPIGSLRSAVSYPSVAGTYPDAAIRDALAAARLPGLAERLDEEENWNARLSGGEQQRVALARALLAKPDWLFLDEATAALDEATEKAVYEALHAHLPGTTIVSIGHRSTLLALHGNHVEMQPGEAGTFTPKTVAAAAEPA